MHKINSVFNLFNETIKRSDLLIASKKLDNTNCQKININIHRNHSFEIISSIISPFLNFAGIKASFNISSYDDSMNFDDIKPCDLEIIWIDIKNYKEDINTYMQERLNTLREISNAPILVLLLDDGKYNISNKIKLPINCELFSIKNLLNSMQDNEILDEIKISITGTRLSNNACIKIAQILGLSIIPSLIMPTLKAIILDLDNTLYDGILGEDGVENIKLTNNHKLLQNKILEYKKQGFLIALASKNNKEDVEDLFNKRSDFPLKLSDFDSIHANWKLKSDNIKNIADEFNISLDSMLFIDDNIAEIENIKPLGVKNILAINPNEVLKILSMFPQMRKTTINNEDKIRANDIKANIKRNALNKLSTEEYFSNLDIKLEFSINDKSNINRITELLNKTNQFISNYTRPTINEVSLWMNNNHSCVISISMNDRLSDSGIIGIVIGEINNKQINILDIAISCRALGRRLESIILNTSFEIINNELHGNKTINILYKQGDRNKPFLDTLESICNINLEHSKNNIATIKLNEINMHGLNITIKGNNNAK